MVGFKKMNSKEFAGRIALVTGGSRGIGRAVCLALARQGADIALNYTSNDEAARSARDEITALGVNCELFKADVSGPDAVKAMIAGAEGTLGPIDLLVTCAGVARVEDHTEIDTDAWRRMMAINVDGTCWPVLAVKNGMLARGFGRIVCIASIAGLRPRPKMIPYSTSKAAVIGFIRSCAEALAPAVRVNGVAPGLIETDMTAVMDAALKAKMTQEAMLKRNGKPEDIAETVLFLLSERSSFIAGQTLVVDGGRVTLP